MKSPLLETIAGIAHGFGTRAEPLPCALGERWEIAAPLWKQVHGAAVAEAAGPRAQCGDVDALFSFEPGVPVAVRTADCVPVLLARTGGGGVAAAHAGWRGTRARIVEALWRALAERGEDPGDWVASVGPAIGPCCYEVSEGLAKDFIGSFPEIPAAEVCPRPRILDLQTVNARMLRALGIGQVEILRHCTRCATDGSGNPVYHSYRREGAGTRQYSGLIIKQPTGTPA